jgi:hypothetical protein
MSVAGVTDGPVPIGTAGAAAWNHTTVWGASTSLSAGNTVLTVTVTQFWANWSGFGAKVGTIQFAPAPTLKDRAGNPAGGVFTRAVQLF